MKENHNLNLEIKFQYFELFIFYIILINFNYLKKISNKTFKLKSLHSKMYTIYSKSNNIKTKIKSKNIILSFNLCIQPCNQIIQTRTDV